MIDVSRIIVNYNTCELTKQCIDSVFKKTSGISFEVIVVDNDSKDDSIKVLSQNACITYNHEKRQYPPTKVLIKSEIGNTRVTEYLHNYHIELK